MISSLLSRVVILVLGTLYPAYASYKAIRNKDVDEYVKWMMYWVVFALFTSAETVTDMFLGFWFPFYYELKIVVVLWLLSPATEGSSMLYRQFVHPNLVKREKEIDEYLHKAKEESYKTVVELGTKGVQYASRVIMQTAINGGGGLMNTLRKSYSVGDVTDGRAITNSQRSGVVLHELEDNQQQLRGRQLTPLQDVSDSEFEEIGEDLEEILMRPPTQPAPRSRVGTREVYFSEIDHSSRRRANDAERYIGEVRSVEDISSGYSSTEFLPAEHMDMDEHEPVTRRTGTTRRGTARPVTIVGSSRGAAKNLDPDYVPSYATLPRQPKKRTTKNSGTSTSGKP